MARQTPSAAMSDPHQADQRRMVFLLINMYQLQLVRGCGSDECNTPTCYTYRKSHHSRPLRRLTPASARAAAFYLADSEEPEAQLCPYVVQYILHPLSQRRHGSQITIDALVGFTNHIANMSNADSELATATRQDPASFSQHLFNSPSAKSCLTKASKAPNSASNPDISSSLHSKNPQRKHKAMAEAGDFLQISVDRFHQHRDTALVASAFTTVVEELASFKTCIDPASSDSSSNSDPIGLRLATTLTTCFAKLLNSSSKKVRPRGNFLHSVLECSIPLSPEDHLLSLVLQSILSLFARLETSKLADLQSWLKQIFLGAWDKTVLIDSTSLAGAVLTLADILYYFAQETDLCITFFGLKMQDPFQAALHWKRMDLSDGNDGHVCLLDYPWLLSTESQAHCFRASCLHRMADAFGESSLNLRLLRGSASGLVSDVQRFPPEVLSIQSGQLQIATSNFLTLQIDRGNILGDSFASLWHRQQRELFRPLKVKMSNAGEVGVDQGGLAQEFFRIIFSDVFSPELAIFTVDERTRMAWFDPKSLEPLYKFELLGILMALAVFNGFTLPVNFPLAFYRKLCDLPVNTLAHIEDGWQELTKGLRQLLEWQDGDVGDIFSRTYVFTFEAYGKMVHVNMTKDNSEWSPIRAMTSSAMSDEDAPLVTNSTRQRYVRDYIQWLTEKSISRQCKAFARGFHRILDVDLLRTVEPHVLRNIVEGERNIDTAALRRVARYDAGFCSHRSYIRDFWEIVDSFDERHKKQLLEFVTASDRIPVTGIDSVDFVVQRHGGDTNSLPTSVTCFGRLLLPQYDSKEKLRKKLELALENSKGFGLS